MGAKRIAVLILAMLLATIGIYAWARGVATAQLGSLLCVSISLAILYVWRGNSLPDFIYRYEIVQRDDDPRNISPRVYLPLILAALIVAAVLLFLTLRR
jgi:hypothetical protein